MHLTKGMQRCATECKGGFGCNLGAILHSVRLYLWVVPNSFATSGHRLSFTSFLWFSQTNLEVCGQRAQYFAGFAHFSTWQLPVAGSNIGRSAMRYLCGRIVPRRREALTHAGINARPQPRGTRVSKSFPTT